MAKQFEQLIREEEETFEIIGEVIMGLVCFRLKVIFFKGYFLKFHLLKKEHISKGSNELNEKLLKSITKEGLIFMVPGQINGCYFIRFAICASSTQLRHIQFAFDTILKHSKLILEK